MRRKITIDQLRPGMYVVSTNRSWISVPFFRKNIRDEKVIAELRSYKVTDVIIDLDRGLDVGGHERAPAAPLVPGSPEAVQRHFGQAVEVHSMVLEQTCELMEEVSAGNAITEEQANQQVSLLMDQIFEDPQSMLCVSVLRSSDQGIFNHCVNLSILALFVGKSMNLGKGELLMLGKAALLHDIGKCMLPRELVARYHATGRASDQYQLHVVRGLNYLQKMKGLDPMVAQFAGEHHERPDGRGYPHGLKGDDISWYGKLAAVLNAYDDGVNRGTGGEAIDPREVLDRMRQEVGARFDAKAFSALEKCLGPYPPGTSLMLDSGEMAIAYEPNAAQPEHPKVLLLTRPDGTFREHPLPVPLGTSDCEDGLARGIVTSMTAADTNFNPIDFLANYSSKRP
ncbi:DUF3391 domain-containing protein [Sulfidibacter corallicola]|uniref:DUF3391 domain-containing protein n=1 Tax=Sulfidibacter corallicola TaxID=2818388 RepID=A0A8A4TH64_SULCO|nr:HD-GYP domain-containing protein [Sulfidibacter corallicola]QTD48078.1 DUF3391 domain-containing protein [Sulfidibacter corallicola]